MSEKYDVRLPLKLFVSEAPRIVFDLSPDGHLAPKTWEVSPKTEANAT